MFFTSPPRNLRELNASFDSLINKRKFEKAARLASDYKDRVKKSKHLSHSQILSETAIAYYYLCVAIDQQIRNNPKKQSFEFYKAFFASYIASYRYFQQLLHTDVKGWEKDHALHPQFENLNALYKGLYNKFGHDQNLERADIAVNRTLSARQF